MSSHRLFFPFAQGDQVSCVNPLHELQPMAICNQHFSLGLRAHTQTPSGKIFPPPEKTTLTTRDHSSATSSKGQIYVRSPFRNGHPSHCKLSSFRNTDTLFGTGVCQHHRSPLPMTISPECLCASHCSHFEGMRLRLQLMHCTTSF